MQLDQDTAMELLNDAATTVIVLDLDARFMWVSDSIRALAGFEPEEIIGTSGLDLIHPDDVERFAAGLSVLTSEPGPFAEQAGRFRDKAGEYQELRLQTLRSMTIGGKPGIAIALRPVDLELQVNQAFRVIAHGGSWQEAAEVLLQATTRGRKMWSSIHFPQSRLAGTRVMGPDRVPNQIADLRELSLAADLDERVLPWDMAETTGWLGIDDIDEPLLLEFFERYDVRSIHILPIILESGRHVATLTYWHDREIRGGAPIAANANEFQASALRLAFEREHTMRVLKEAAITDSMTGLFNRAGFYEKLEGAAAGVIAYFDLNGFKAVNDKHGHRIGDEVLIEVASRLREATRSTEIVARVGGDEFVLFAPHVAPDEVTPLHQRLRTALNGPINIDGRSFDISVSIGVALIEGDTDTEAAVERADRAMLASKRRHREATQTRQRTA